MCILGTVDRLITAHFIDNGKIEILMAIILYLYNGNGGMHVYIPSNCIDDGKYKSDKCHFIAVQIHYGT